MPYRSAVSAALPLPELMDGMFNTFDLMNQSEVHPVVTAAITSFGFVFMHPFDEGHFGWLKLLPQMLPQSNFKQNKGSTVTG